MTDEEIEKAFADAMAADDIPQPPRRRAKPAATEKGFYEAFVKAHGIPQPPCTNGEVVQSAIDYAKKALAEAVTWAGEHPDEVLVVGLPVLLAFRLSFKYRMSLTEHLLITETAREFGMLSLRQWREWKARPARPSLKEVV